MTGLLGANCYHSYYPFIPGVSERMYPDEWLDKMNAEENTPKSFMGKEYTAYEARQRQRYLERCMRAQREKVELLKEGGADDDDVMLARCKYQAQLDEYKRFSKAMKLPEQRERIYYDMRGWIAPTQKQMNEFFAKQAEKKATKQTEADKHKERAEEARREDMEKPRGILSASTSEKPVETKVIFVKRIDRNNPEAVKAVIDEFEEKHRASEIEHAVVITDAGEVYHCSGVIDGVDISATKKDLNNSIVSHNHPISVSEFSFGGDDRTAFNNHGIAKMRGVDLKYTYEMDRGSKVVDEHPSIPEMMSDPECSEHDVNITFAERFGYGYTRTKVTGNG